MTDEALEPAETAEVTEEITQEAPEQSVEAPADTGTLLSGDEGDGADGAVPEKYEYTPPEGFPISEEAQSRLEAFGETAREMGLSQDQYQSLIDYDLQRGLDAQEQLAAGYDERINAWADEVRADPELGGAKLQDNLAMAKAGMDAFASDGLRKLMSKPTPENPDGLGLGSHPEIIRFMNRLGRAIGESELILGDGRKVNDEDGLKRMYPTMFQ